MTHIALLCFPDVTQLDLTGPYEVLCRLPDARVDLIWKDLAPVRTQHGMCITPTARFDDVERSDILCVPGGFGVDRLLTDAHTVDTVRRLAAHARFVTSVCTGALLLGAAGLLKGKRATTHWSAFELLTEYGATPTRGRVVRDGTLITGGGVTAGIDFGLEIAAMLAGEEIAQAIQLAIEYDPAPPFNAGHPDQAPGTVVRMARQRLAERQTSLRAMIAASKSGMG